MVVRITTTVNTYIDIYCSLVSHTAVSSTAAESRGLVCVCYWSHARSVDRSMVGEGMPVGDALLSQRRIAECSCGWKQLGTGPVAASSRYHGCAGCGRTALRRSP